MDSKGCVSCFLLGAFIGSILSYVNMLFMMIPYEMISTKEIIPRILTFSLVNLCEFMILFLVLSLCSNFVFFIYNIANSFLSALWVPPKEKKE